MREQRWRGVLFGGVLTAALASCGNHQRAPVSYAGPLRSRDLDRGGHIFRTFCNPCHAGRVTPDGYGWSPAQMRRQIREGNREMPGIRSDYLSDEDMESVLAFLTVIEAVEAPLPDIEDEAGSASRPSPSLGPASSEDHVAAAEGTAPVEAAASERSATDPHDAGTASEGAASDPSDAGAASEEATPAAPDDEPRTHSPAGALDDPSKRPSSR